MDTMKQAMLKARINAVLPLKQVKVHLGVTRLKSGVTLLQEAWVTIPQSKRTRKTWTGNL